jgi:RNA polymerase sigma-70 factor (ECF subfamily)
METLADDRLVTLAQNGDVGAFTTLILRHKEKIFKTVYWMTKNQQDTDDLCQEVFLHVYKNLEEFKGRSSFYTWTYRIAVNRTLNFLKKGKREKNRSQIPVEACSAIEKEGEAPEKKSLRAELGKKLNQAIDNLPTSYKIAFVLVVLQGMSHNQASEVLGCSENTISWRMFRARKLLQGELSPYLGRNR